MAKKANLHFISGLPRSGSTLFSAILRQNPRFQAGMSSPVSVMYINMLEALSERNEFAMFIPEGKKPEMMKSIFETYYREKFEADQIVFDTSRIWCSKTNGLNLLYPNSYIFCCVRNLAWVLDSLERKIREHPFELSKIFNFEKSDNVYGRIEGLTAANGLVGFSWNALREGFFGEHAHRLVLIQYESLTRNPKVIMDKLYDLIGEERFTHDFDNVNYAEPEFDARLGTPDLHKVRSKVKSEPRRTILPTDLFERFESWAFWVNQSYNIRNVPVW